MRKKALQILIAVTLTFSMFILSEIITFADVSASGNRQICSPDPIMPENSVLISCNEPVNAADKLPKYLPNKEILKDCELELAFVDGEEISNITMHDYLIGVVMSEIPYTFEFEAVKAQAVAARTYALYITQTDKRHNTLNTVCTSSAHCSGYLSKEEYIARYGEQAYTKAYETIEKAVRYTDGEIIKYNDAICCAVFHASSYRSTENSYNLWGTETPYLKSVDTPEASDTATLDISQDKMIQYLNQHGAPNGNYADISIEYNDSGRCENITIAGVTICADKLRTRFALKSCDFDLSYSDGFFSFTTYGYGHGIGLSQVGANEMAKQGFSYDEILTHYYTGVSLSEY